MKEKKIYTVSVSGQLSFSQDLIHSKFLSSKSIWQKISNFTML